MELAMLNQVWKTIRIGGVSSETLLEQIKTICPRGFHNSNEWSRSMMRVDGFTTASETSNLVLMKLSVRELGFTEVPSVATALARIDELDGLCPAEVGPHLLLQGAGDKDYLRIAMRPLPARAPSLGGIFNAIFMISAGTELGAYDADRQCRSLDMKFVLVNALASRSKFF